MLAIIKKSNLIFILIIGLLAGAGNKGYAQLCTGSLGDPVVKIDFGQGVATHAGGLPAGTTSYNYTSADFPGDGSYTVENSTAGAGNVWWSTLDHTGNTAGYMMVVNASVSKTDYFYKSTITGLCPGTTFEFAAWITNLLRSNDISPPNITFTITTTGGSILGTYNTGDIPLTPAGPVWKQYGTFFTTPAGVTDVIIKMTNNSAGGAPANDLALDDITFRPCGPVVNTNVVSVNGSSAATAQTICTGTNRSFTFSSSVFGGSYINPAYQWQVNDGTGWVNIAGANTQTYVVNFQPATAGVYKYRTLASEAANSGTASCQVASNDELTITVSGSPTAAFTQASSNVSCLFSIVDFQDQSTAPTPGITSWAWDFGDGQTSNLVNPSHTYATAGDHTVTLTVANSGGCSSSTSKIIHTNAKLVAAFTTSASTCLNNAVTLTDQSTIDPADGRIVTWIWNFGDGSPEEKHDNNLPFQHTFLKAGILNASLEVRSSNNCASDITYYNVTIYDAPTADFIMPDACIKDAAQFTDATVFAGDKTSLTYQWNFGDPASGALNTSTLQNPTHKYPSAGNYQVSLIVSSPLGCQSALKTQAFTVNGQEPVAKLDFNTPTCSQQAVFTNRSTVDFGSITKLEIYFDYDGDKTNKGVYTKALNQIPNDGIITHDYGSSTVQRTYRIVMFASSGESCISTPFDGKIVINPKPVVTLSTTGPLCQEDAAVQINANTGAFTGPPGVFTGKGISSTGLFTPALADLGVSTINYIFTDSNGCTDTTSQQVTVYATPTVTMAATAAALEGEQITFNPKVTGDSLTYNWTPATGISNPTQLNPSVSPTDNITYTLTVKSGKGCIALAQVTVSVLKTPVVPNAFTPNNDGINDTWVIKYLSSYPGATVEVFNRYGAKVYTSNGYPVPWDGKFKGANLPFGVYYYIIDPKSGRKPITGSLTIIK